MKWCIKQIKDRINRTIVEEYSPKCFIEPETVRGEMIAWFKSIDKKGEYRTYVENSPFLSELF